MILSRFTLRHFQSNTVVVPDEELFALPEKVLQFGTGVLLRGLPDYFIDEANRQGIFNGRIVVVKSTPGGVSLFEKQDCLYTLCVRGRQNGEGVEENIINSAISRVLNAAEEWKAVLDCAYNPELQVIISNTTEVGIQLVNDDIRSLPPKSFPGKLLAFLYERFKAFKGSKESGMVIVPTEMIPDNGKKLETIVFELAHLNGLEVDFIEWLEESNHFCNSLVDRLVPGTPGKDLHNKVEEDLGYSDPLLIMSEVHRLWAIEGDEKVKEILSFAQADEGIFVAPSIELHRELKFRMLNATHTFSCGLSYLAGSETVKESMENGPNASFISGLMLEEIAQSIPLQIEQEVIQDYGRIVLRRFQNPDLQHPWLKISENYSSKMRTRCIPLLLRHYQLCESVPERMALCFAAYLFFTKPVLKKDGVYFGEYNGQAYPIQDEQAEVYYKRWTGLSTAALVQEVLKDEAFWGEDLSLLPGFQKAVLENLNRMLQEGVKEALINIRGKEKVAA